MCARGTTKLIRIAAGWNGSGESRRDGSYDIPIDSCIADLVKALNDGGIATRNSCCSHGKGPGRIDLVDGRVLLVEASPAPASD